MNKQVLYIAGAIAAVLGLYFITTRRDAIVQLPQIGQVATAPGPDTTGAELGFKANIFSTYTDYLSKLAAGEQQTARVKLQSDLESNRIAAGTTAATLREQGQTERQRLSEQAQTDRAKIFADADVATVGQRSAAELQRLQIQDQLARRQISAQSQSNALNAILRALGQLGRGSGSGSGSGSGGNQPTQQRRRQGGYTIGYPGGIGPILTPPFNPDYPSINLPGFGIDDFFNPFADYYDPFYGNGSGGEGIPRLGDDFSTDLDYDPYSGFSGYVDTYGGGGGYVDTYGGGGGFDPYGGDYYDAAFFDFA